MKRSACHACIVLLAACTPSRTRAGVELPSRGPARATERIESVALAAAHPARVWADIDRDVIAVGKVPSIAIYLEGVRMESDAVVQPRRVLDPDGQPLPRECDEARAADGRWGGAMVDLRCAPMTRAGRYVVEVDPAAAGYGGEVIEIPVRVVDSPPAARAVPAGFVPVPLSTETPKFDCKETRDYEPELRAGSLAIVRYQPPIAPPLPQAVRARAAELGDAHRVEPFDGGWIFATNHGEWGGGLEWLPSTSGPLIDLVLALSADDDTPQNVNRLVRNGSKLYVLQGLSHLGLSEGQLAAVWREQGRFRANVIARYRSEPVAFVRVSDHEWLVLTWNAVWKTSDAGASEVVARLPAVVRYPTSLVRTPDDVLLIGMREGVLRLTPYWTDAPRYAAEVVMPEDRYAHPCEGWDDELHE